MNLRSSREIKIERRIPYKRMQSMNQSGIGLMIQVYIQPLPLFTISDEATPQRNRNMNDC